MNLNDFGVKIYSQFKEDGITRKIFDLIGTTNKVCVEFGVQNGTECCSKVMWNNHGFRPILFDNEHENKNINLHKETITIDNVLDLFARHDVPKELDLLVVDIDSYDFYVVHKILEEYTPRLLIVETNPTFLKEDKVVLLDHEVAGGYHGAGTKAWFDTLNNKGYRMVCHESCGINAFFVYGDGLATIVDDFNNFDLLYSAPSLPVRLEDYQLYPDWPVLTSTEALKLINKEGE